MSQPEEYALFRWLHCSSVSCLTWCRSGSEDDRVCEGCSVGIGGGDSHAPMGALSEAIPRATFFRLVAKWNTVLGPYSKAVRVFSKHRDESCLSTETSHVSFQLGRKCQDLVIDSRFYPRNRSGPNTIHDSRHAVSIYPLSQN